MILSSHRHNKEDKMNTIPAYTLAKINCDIQLKLKRAIDLTTNYDLCLAGLEVRSAEILIEFLTWLKIGAYEAAWDHMNEHDLDYREDYPELVDYLGC